MSDGNLTVFEKQQALASQARKISVTRDVLYHGTRYPSSILNTGTILRDTRSIAVSFTRSPDIAAYWAFVPRDGDDGRGAILIFDRQSLRCRYRIESFHDPIWDTETFRNNEMEERICGDVVDIGNHLVGLVTTLTVCRSQKEKQLNRRHRLRLSTLNKQVRIRIRGRTSNKAFERELAECRRLDEEGLQAARSLFASLKGEAVTADNLDG